MHNLEQKIRDLKAPQLATLRYLMQGLDNSEIAKKRMVALKTVKYSLCILYKKIGLETRHLVLANCFNHRFLIEELYQESMLTPSKLGRVQVDTIKHAIHKYNIAFDALTLLATSNIHNPKGFADNILLQLKEVDKSFGVDL